MELLSPVRSPVVLHPAAHLVKVVHLNFRLLDEGVLEHDLLDEVVPGEAGELLLHLLLQVRLGGSSSVKGLPAPIFEEMPPGGQQPLQRVTNLGSLDKSSEPDLTVET